MGKRVRLLASQHRKLSLENTGSGSRWLDTVSGDCDCASPRACEGLQQSPFDDHTKRKLKATATGEKANHGNPR
jgi:hypothetical protein